MARTSPLRISSLAFWRSSAYLIIAGKTDASPDQINTRSIALVEIFSGNCFNSVSSKASSITGFRGYFFLIIVPREIGSWSSIRSITITISNFFFFIASRASKPVETLLTRGA